MSSSILPDPAALIVKVHTDRDGCRFEIRVTTLTHQGDESIFEASEPVMSPNVAERRGRRWIERYEQSTNKERCRMCGYSWSSVSRHLARERSEATTKA